ncbi:hypothetical protein ACHAWU_004768 [Discostella pseudostelligera]|uniref:Uncharacterized protein n=1 Tax=Discostella pseudostelligera TaxID=259834 RepID=A0ABD3MDM9_9STRA
MSEFNEPSELNNLNSEISTLKQIQSGVKSAKVSPDEARASIATYVQKAGDKDGFLKPDPGVEVRNIYHTNVKGGGGGGGGGSGGVSGGGGAASAASGGSGGCCVIL